MDARALRRRLIDCRELAAWDFAVLDGWGLFDFSKLGWLESKPDVMVLCGVSTREFEMEEADGDRGGGGGDPAGRRAD